MLHGSETWPVKKENELMLQQTEMRMIRWMSGVKVTDRFMSCQLRERRGIDDITSVIQRHRLRWYLHILRKDDWMKKCMDYEVEGMRSIGRSKKTWSAVIKKDCQSLKICMEEMEKIKYVVYYLGRKTASVSECFSGISSPWLSG